MRVGNLDVAIGIALITAVVLLIAKSSASAFQPLQQLGRNLIEQHRLNQVSPEIHVFGQGTNFNYGKNTGTGYSHNFGHGGPRSVIVTGLTQNPGSEKKEPSYNPWEYNEIMPQLKKQRKQEKGCYICRGRNLHSQKYCRLWSRRIRSDVSKPNLR